MANSRHLAPMRVSDDGSVLPLQLVRLGESSEDRGRREKFVQDLLRAAAEKGGADAQFAATVLLAAIDAVDLDVGAELIKRLRASANP